MDSANPPPVGAAAYIFQDWTVIVLILIAVFAVLVIAGMIWGQKKARERHRVEEAAEERAEEAGVPLPPAPPPPPIDADAGLPRDEPPLVPEPETWLEQATKSETSWWQDWAEWIGVRSGARVAPPADGCAFRAKGGESILSTSPRGCTSIPSLPRKCTMSFPQARR